MVLAVIHTKKRKSHAFFVVCDFILVRNKVMGPETAFVAVKNNVD